MSAPPTTARRSGVVPAAVEDVFAATLSLPLPRLYRRRYALMPPVVSVRDQQGEFDTPGQTRIFRTGDGGEFREELLTLDRPSEFSNRLTVLKGPFAPLVATIEETWSFVPLGTGTEATWEWRMFARAAPGRLLLPAIGRLWQGYAAGVLAQLTDEISGRA